MTGKTNVVEWKNIGPDDIVYRYEHSDLRTLTSLTVREWEVAIFMRDGQLYDVMPPGRHVITSANIPLITKLYNSLLRYKETPFKVDIIFVAKKIFSAKWGIRTMVKADPDYMMQMPLMANGEYQFRVNDPVIFLTQVLGGQSNYSTGAVSNFMRSFMNEQIMQQLSKQYFTDAYTNLEKASSVTMVSIAEYFTQRGMELVAFKISNVDTEEKYRENLNEYLRQMTATGKELRQYESMDRMSTAIGNSQGGAAMGAGMLLFPQMYQNLNQQQIQQQQVPKVLCPYCGSMNDYPFKFCRECGKPPLVQQAAQSEAAATGEKAFLVCPYCGEELNLPKTPKFCPYCSEQLNQR
ncbi:MAG: SPFH domain-containing protein [Methanimicrococcus sp.]|nr:SPFH domain-containing protein [Methanimicrococcus sp.]